MRTVQRFVTSARPEHVWSILADVEHWHTWTPTIVEIKPIGTEGLRAGARYRITQPKVGASIYEVTECTPNHGFVWVKRLWGGAFVADHRIAPLNTGTEVELSFRSTGLVAHVASMLFSNLIREYAATEASSLKQRCEAR